MSEAMTEHSMCQPGRPSPHGDCHAGSPGLELFQSAKSFLLRLPASPPPAAPSDSAISASDVSPVCGSSLR